MPLTRWETNSLVTARLGGELIGLVNAISAGNAVAFYERMGFARAGQTVPMWIYAGTEH